MRNTETIRHTVAQDPKFTREIKRELKETQGKFLSTYQEREYQLEKYRAMIKRAKQQAAATNLQQNSAR